jgi:uncharacterized membrane protein
MHTTDTAPRSPFRDIPVDVLRGLAIILMVGANLIPYLLEPPVPFWLRLGASLAAPLFIFLSGMMVPLSCRTKQRSLSYFLMKGGLVFAIAALLDLLVWGFFPFVDFDVLYLIGVSLPLVYLYISLPFRARLAVFFSIILITPVLQFLAGYSGLLFQPPVMAVLGGVTLPSFAVLLTQWLVNGWFPIFPWLAVALLGAEAGSFRWQANTIIPFTRRGMMLLSGSILFLGLLFWYLIPGPELIRAGYVELFYPPTPEFLFFVTGAIFCLFILADRLPLTSRIFNPVRAMGECSLAIYIVHTMIIAFCIEPFHTKVPLGPFFTGYLIFICGMVLVAYGLRLVRLNVKTPPFALRVLIGG